MRIADQAVALLRPLHPATRAWALATVLATLECEHTGLVETIGKLMLQGFEEG